MEGPSCKGLVIAPAVKVLLAERSRFESELPAELHHYLDEPVDEGQWYPTEELLAILDVIARCMLPNEPRSQAFEYFGMVAAQRDLLGEQRLVGPAMRTSTAGSFSGVINAEQSVDTMLERAFGMWLIYHDAGEFQLRRTGEREVTVVHAGYTRPSEELCHMIHGYAREVMRICETPGRFEKVQCKGLGDERCEWTLTYDDGVDTAALSRFEKA